MTYAQRASHGQTLAVLLQLHAIDQVYWSSVGKSVYQMSRVIGQSFVVGPLLACEFDCSLLQEGVHSFLLSVRRRVGQEERELNMLLASSHL
jgi:hypothetical protein